MNHVLESVMLILYAQPYTLKIAGQKHYIITEPSDVMSVYKHNKSLTFDSSVSEVLGLM